MCPYCNSQSPYDKINTYSIPETYFIAIIKLLSGKQMQGTNKLTPHNDMQRSIQINQPTRLNSFTSLLLDVLCRSTCFGRLHAHHQELTTALTASGFTLECGRSSVVSRGLAG